MELLEPPAMIERIRWLIFLGDIVNVYDEIRMREMDPGARVAYAEMLHELDKLMDKMTWRVPTSFPEDEKYNPYRVYEKLFRRETE